MGAHVTAQRMALQSQFSALTEKVNVVIAGLQRQCDGDRRRLAQLERKVETRLDDDSRKNDGREKWAEIQGSVNGLLEETQALTRRVEGLDERLWARTSGSELTKQRHRELEQQVQALEQQNRLQATVLEETQKRQATKIRRSEHAVEELARRLSKSEEEVRARTSGPQQGYMEQRLAAIEQNQEQFDADMRALQEQIDEGFAAVGESQADDAAGAPEGGHAHLEEAVQAVERSMSALEKKVSSQIEDLASNYASLKVKADGQTNRVSSLIERLETAHEPAIESLRAEIVQARSQDRRDLDGEMAALRSRLQEHSEGHEESVAEIREHIRHTKAEMAALTLRPEENPALRTFEDRMDVHEREVRELHARFDTLPLASERALADEREDEKLGDDWEDLRRRLEWLEEQGAAGAAVDTVDQRQVQQVQNSICELLEQVSNLKQRTSSGEAASTALQQQVQQLQMMIERRQGDDSGSMRAVSEVEAKVGAISQQVAHIDARLLEVEGGLEFARENDTRPLDEVSAVSVASEAASTAPGGRSLPPLPRGEVDRDRAGSGDGGSRSGVGLQEKLEAKLEVVADHLEVIDELAERVAEVEQRLSAIASGGAQASSVSEDMGVDASQVSFGPPAGSQSVYTNLTREVEGLSTEVDELRKRLLVAERGLGKLEDTEEEAKPGCSGGGEEIQKINERVAQLEADFGDAARATEVEEMDSRLAAAENALSQLKINANSPATPDKSLMERIGAVEDRLGTIASSQRTDEQLRSQVEEQVKELTSDLTKELEILVQQQEEISETKAYVAASVEDLSEQMAALKDVSSKGVDSSALAEMQEDLLETKKMMSLSPKKEVDTGALAEMRRDMAETRSMLEGRVQKIETGHSQIHTKQEEASKLKDEVSKLVDSMPRVDELSEEVSKLMEKVSKQEQFGEEVSKLRDKVCKHDGLSDDMSNVQKDLSEARASLGSRIEQVEKANERLQTTQDEHGKLAPQLQDIKDEHGKFMPQLQAFKDELSTQMQAIMPQVQAQLQAIKPESNDSGVSETQLQELKDELSKLREKPDGGDSGALEAQLKEIKDELSTLDDKAGKNEIFKLAMDLQEHKSSVKDLHEKVLSAETNIGALREAASTREQAAELAEKRAEVEGGMIDRLRIIEERLGEGINSNLGGSASEEQARSQVEDQVQKLTAQVSSELESLADHQADLAGARETLKTLATQVTSGSGATGGTAPAQSSAPGVEAKLSDFKVRLEKAENRLEAAEEVSASLRKDLEQLQDVSSLDEVREQLGEMRAKLSEKQLQGHGTPSSVRKVGIGIGGETDPVSSPMSFFQNKLDNLSEQVADLHSKMLDGAGTASVAAKGESLKEGSLNFSLTGERGGSLNYSLTEQSRQGGRNSRGGSRGNSPTNSIGDELEDLVKACEDVPAGKNRRGLGGDVLDNLVSKPSSGGSNDALDSLVGGGGGSGKTGSDALDSLVGGSSSSGKKPEKDRPRPPALSFDEEHSGHLPSVAEEESADLEVDESLNLAPGSASGSGSAGIAGKMRTPKSMRSSPAGLESPSGGILEVSQSANEVSVGVDISVEDSLELEKCDHWEPVESAQVAAKAQASVSADRAAGGASGGGGASSTSSTPAGSPAASPAYGSKSESPKDKLEKPQQTKAADALDSLMGPNKSSMAPMAGSPPGKAAGSVGLAGTKAVTKDDDDNEYGNESFDNDDMSVPESIEESLEDSDSNAWGTGEAV